MTRPGPDELERLRQAFTALAEAPGSDDRSHDPGRIWQAVRGDLQTSEIEELADQAGRSADTASAWRLAAELSREFDSQGDQSVVPINRRRPVRWALGLAAAAVVLIGLAFPLYHSFSPDRTPTFRAIDDFEIASELATGTALDRNAFELRWTPTGEDSLYEIVITDSGLAVLDRASFLEEPRYLVSSAVLAGLKNGEEVWWKIDATRPDGTRVSSPTFVTMVR